MKRLLAVMALTAAYGAVPCDLPVAQYALINWQRTPYQIYYFYRGQPAPSDAEVNAYLRRVAAGEEGDANVVFASVDVASLSKPDTPELYKLAWKRAGVKNGDLPCHVILTPRGSVLFRGRLDVATVNAYLDSPARRRLAELLCDGHDGVLLMLASGQEKEDRHAREVVLRVLKRAAAEGLRVGFFRLTRDDPAEKAFVAQLLQVEDDLAEIREPMVFGVFGRGHVVEPCIGRGITEEAVAELIGFMNGPCTCDLKMWNPGMDLLTSFDWDAKVFAD